MSLYELAVLGSPTEDEASCLEETIKQMIAEFGLEIGRDLILHDASSLATRDKRAAFVAVYFGGDKVKDEEQIAGLISESAPIIPSVKIGESFADLIPTVLHETNGHFRRPDDAALIELAAALLECVGLLRRQRRAFVSYRRVESRQAAMQLHDLLSSRGYDVFLDTHDVRPGEPFQEVLWHRLCDSDVVIMLDTPTYFSSKWTRQEIGRSRAKEIHVLRVIWPDHLPNKLTDLSETIHLEQSDLSGTDGPIIDQTAERIVIAAEKLRSRSIASRYMSITGKFRSDIVRIGATVTGIGAHRAISVTLLDDQKIWAYPIVGVPTAELLYDIAGKALKSNQPMPILIYDHIGLSEPWLSHLKWLDEQINAVAVVRSSDVSWAFAAWEARS